MVAQLEVVSLNVSLRWRLKKIRPWQVKATVEYVGHAEHRSVIETIHVINPETLAYWCKKRGGELKMRMTFLKEDLARPTGQGINGLRRLNWLTIGIAWAQDLGVRAAAVRDMVVAMDAGATALR